MRVGLDPSFASWPAAAGLGLHPRSDLLLTAERPTPDLSLAADTHRTTRRLKADSFGGSVVWHSNPSKIHPRPPR